MFSVRFLLLSLSLLSSLLVGVEAHRHLLRSDSGHSALTVDSNGDIGEAPGHEEEAVEGPESFLELGELEGAGSPLTNLNSIEDSLGEKMARSAKVAKKRFHKTVKEINEAKREGRVERDRRGRITKLNLKEDPSAAKNDPDLKPHFHRIGEWRNPRREGGSQGPETEVSSDVATKTNQENKRLKEKLDHSKQEEDAEKREDDFRRDSRETRDKLQYLERQQRERTQNATEESAAVEKESEGEKESQKSEKKRNLRRQSDRGAEESGSESESDQDQKSEQGDHNQEHDDQESNEEHARGNETDSSSHSLSQSESPEESDQEDDSDSDEPAEYKAVPSGSATETAAAETAEEKGQKGTPEEDYSAPEDSIGLGPDANDSAPSTDERGENPMLSRHDSGGESGSDEEFRATEHTDPDYEEESEAIEKAKAHPKAWAHSSDAQEEDSGPRKQDAIDAESRGDDGTRRVVDDDDEDDSDDHSDRDFSMDSGVDGDGSDNSTSASTSKASSLLEKPGSENSTSSHDFQAQGLEGVVSSLLTLGNQMQKEDVDAVDDALPAKALDRKKSLWSSKYQQHGAKVGMKFQAAHKAIVSVKNYGYDNLPSGPEGTKSLQAQWLKKINALKTAYEGQKTEVDGLNDTLAAEIYPGGNVPWKSPLSKSRESESSDSDSHSVLLEVGEGGLEGRRGRRNLGSRRVAFDALKTKLEEFQTGLDTQKTACTDFIGGLDAEGDEIQGGQSVIDNLSAKMNTVNDSLTGIQDEGTELIAQMETEIYPTGVDGDSYLQTRNTPFYQEEFDDLNDTIKEKKAAVQAQLKNFKRIAAGETDLLTKLGLFESTYSHEISAIQVKWGDLTDSLYTTSTDGGGNEVSNGNLDEDEYASAYSAFTDKIEHHLWTQDLSDDWTDVQSAIEGIVTTTTSEETGKSEISDHASEIENAVDSFKKDVLAKAAVLNAKVSNPPADSSLLGKAQAARLKTQVKDAPARTSTTTTTTTKKTGRLSEGTADEDEATTTSTTTAKPSTTTTTTTLKPWSFSEGAGEETTTITTTTTSKNSLSFIERSQAGNKTASVSSEFTAMEGTLTGSAATVSTAIQALKNACETLVVNKTSPSVSHVITETDSFDRAFLARTAAITREVAAAKKRLYGELAANTSEQNQRDAIDGISAEVDEIHSGLDHDLDTLLETIQDSGDREDLKALHNDILTALESFETQGGLAIQAVTAAAFTSAGFSLSETGAGANKTKKSPWDDLEKQRAEEKAEWDASWTAETEAVETKKGEQQFRLLETAIKHRRATIRNKLKAFRKLVIEGVPSEDRANILTLLEAVNGSIQLSLSNQFDHFSQINVVWFTDQAEHSSDAQKMVRITALKEAINSLNKGPYITAKDGLWTRVKRDVGRSKYLNVEERGAVRDELETALNSIDSSVKEYIHVCAKKMTALETELLREPEGVNNSNYSSSAYSSSAYISSASMLEKGEVGAGGGSRAGHTGQTAEESEPDDGELPIPTPSSGFSLVQRNDPLLNLNHPVGGPVPSKDPNTLPNDGSSIHPAAYLVAYEHLNTTIRNRRSVVKDAISELLTRSKGKTEGNDWPNAQAEPELEAKVEAVKAAWRTAAAQVILREHSAKAVLFPGIITTATTITTSTTATTGAISFVETSSDAHKAQHKHRRHSRGRVAFLGDPVGPKKDALLALRQQIVDSKAAVVQPMADLKSYILGLTGAYWTSDRGSYKKRLLEKRRDLRLAIRDSVAHGVNRTNAIWGIVFNPIGTEFSTDTSSAEDSEDDFAEDSDAVTRTSSVSALEDAVGEAESESSSFHEEKSDSAEKLAREQHLERLADAKEDSKYGRAARSRLLLEKTDWGRKLGEESDRVLRGYVGFNKGNGKIDLSLVTAPADWELVENLALSRGVAIKGQERSYSLAEARDLFGDGPPAPHQKEEKKPQPGWFASGPAPPRSHNEGRGPDKQQQGWFSKLKKTFGLDESADGVSFFQESSEVIRRKAVVKTGKLGKLHHLQREKSESEGYHSEEFGDEHHSEHPQHSVSVSIKGGDPLAHHSVSVSASGALADIPVSLTQKRGGKSGSKSRLESHSTLTGGGVGYKPGAKYTKTCLDDGSSCIVIPRKKVGDSEKYDQKLDYAYSSYGGSGHDQGWMGSGGGWMPQRSLAKTSGAALNGNPLDEWNIKSSSEANSMKQQFIKHQSKYPPERKDWIEISLPENKRWVVSAVYVAGGSIGNVGNQNAGIATKGCVSELMLLFADCENPTGSKSFLETGDKLKGNSTVSHHKPRKHGHHHKHRHSHQATSWAELAADPVPAAAAGAGGEGAAAATSTSESTGCVWKESKPLDLSSFCKKPISPSIVNPGSGDSTRKMWNRKASDNVREGKEASLGFANPSAANGESLAIVSRKIRIVPLNYVHLPILRVAIELRGLVCHCEGGETVGNGECATPVLNGEYDREEASPVSTNHCAICNQAGMALEGASCKASSSKSLGIAIGILLVLGVLGFVAKDFVSSNQELASQGLGNVGAASKL